MRTLNTKEFFLDENNPEVRLVSYCASTSQEVPFNNKRKAMLVIPGGGYSFCSDREGEPIALKYLANGFNAFVLYYSLKEHAKFPQPLIDASKAMKLIKDNAEEFNIDPDFVYAVGFSAGGHLACALGTMWDSKEVYNAVQMPFGYNKPRGVVLAYPVVTAGKFAHRGSIDNILGVKDSLNLPESELDSVSLEKHVSENTCPMFIWHTANDRTVPIQNSLMLAEALAEHKIPFELRVFPNGSHGLSLADESVGYQTNEHTVRIQRWITDSIGWINLT